MLPGIFGLPIVPGYHIQELFLLGKFAAKKYVLTPLTYVICCTWHKDLIMASNDNDISNDNMSIEDFRLWTTNSLKTFLRVRKKRNNGTFDELVAR